VAQHFGHVRAGGHLLCDGFACFLVATAYEVYAGTSAEYSRKDSTAYDRHEHCIMVLVPTISPLKIAGIPWLYWLR
jgi:hypothetical protein